MAKLEKTPPYCRAQFVDPWPRRVCFETHSQGHAHHRIQRQADYRQRSRSALQPRARAFAAYDAFSRSKAVG